MEVHELIQALKKVPPTRLKIIELAWEVIGADGKVDMDKAMFFSNELKVAIDEAESYVRTVSGMVHCLREISRS